MIIDGVSGDIEISQKLNGLSKEDFLVLKNIIEVFKEQNGLISDTK